MQTPGRIQFLDEVVGVLVILSEEAQGDSGDWIMTPGAVETAEKVVAFLGKQHGGKQGEKNNLQLNST